ncbi:MAG: CoA-binding protein [Dehalococcoidia bacterium]|nr:CoA-binding protein [Dehalococcoidia bacterium]
MNLLKDIVGQLDRAFNPRSVAVVGDKAEMGYMWLRSLATFQGRVYSVQIDEQEFPGIEALGVKNYPRLLDIPDEVDYVIVAVPRAIAPQIVKQCIQKKVGGAMLFTSGFAESNTEEGIGLQKTITDMACDANLNLIGPNCVGIFNPKIGLRHSIDQYSGYGGNVGFISQSGTHATFFTLVGEVNGITISKSVSYGNAAVLDATDYLEYLGEDEDTNIIGIYIEGVKDGRRFFSTLRDVARRKPVLLWKGGGTKEGTRATASHTASLAGQPQLWDALIKQCGAIKVANLDEMIDTIKALLYAKPTTGNRVGLAAMTGGQSVAITDAFARAGFDIPLLSEESYRNFASFFNTIGSSYQNPLDMSSNLPHLDRIIRCLDILNDDEMIDVIVLDLPVVFLTRISWHISGFFDDLIDAIAEYKERSGKPLLAILISAHAESEAIEARKKLVARGIPSFPSFERGANALAKVVAYYKSTALQ